MKTQKKTVSLNELLDTSEKNKEQIEEFLESSTTNDQSISALHAKVQQNETTVTQLLATTKASNAEVLAIEPKIKEFYGEINEFREDISTTRKDAQKAVKDNEEETEKLVSNLKILEDQIKDQIQKATGYTLFHSFQKRQETLNKSKNIWVYALAGLVLASICASIFIILTTKEINVAFFWKIIDVHTTDIRNIFLYSPIWARKET